MIQNLIEIANDILKQSDIIEVVSHFIKVEKAGKNYEALCPFHDDKKLGNFFINKDKGIFKCFACNTGGNAITFVQKILNCSFEEAVIKTAEIIGYEDDRLKNATFKKKINPEEEAILNCLKDLSNFYSTSLFLSNDGKDALTYLHDRGLDDDVIKFFNIGYSQSNGKNTIDFLKSKKYSLKTISDTGIMNLNSTPYRDVNAGRISFAIADKNGDIVGFSCRKFRKEDENLSKYINTSSTKLFNKSTILYNLNNAKSESNKVKYVYVLEGFMDVIACYRVGIKSAIGLMGTALTSENVQQLRQLNCEVRVCLDLDDPGQLNMYKIGNMLEEAGIQYRFVNNDVDFKEKDTDEILKIYGEEKLRSYLSNLISFGEWLINYLSKRLNLKLLDGKRKFLNSFIPYLSNVKDEIDFEYYINQLTTLTGFDSNTIMKLLNKYNKAHGKSEKIDESMTRFVPKKNQANDIISRMQLAEKELLRYMLENKEVVKKFESSLNYFITPEYEQISNLICEYFMCVRDDSQYDVKSILSFLRTDEVNFKNKDKIEENILSLTLDELKIPPYKDEIFKELVDTINSERKTMASLEAYHVSTKSKTEIEKSEYAAACLNKLKAQISENDKKRRN